MTPGERPAPDMLCMVVASTRSMPSGNCADGGWFGVPGAVLVAIWGLETDFGANVGNNPGDQTIGPGQSKTYTYYAHPEYGELAALIQDWGNVVENPRNGLFGSIIVGPKGSRYRDPVSGEDITLKSSWRADVLVDRTIPGNDNRKNYRDF